MTATAQTDRGGYCPGEIVGVSVYVNNRSRSDIPGIRLSICQYVEFIASTPGKLKMQKRGPCRIFGGVEEEDGRGKGGWPPLLANSGGLAFKGQLVWGSLIFITNVPIPGDKTLTKTWHSQTS